MGAIHRKSAAPLVPVAPGSSYVCSAPAAVSIVLWPPAFICPRLGASGCLGQAGLRGLRDELKTIVLSIAALLYQSPDDIE